MGESVVLYEILFLEERGRLGIPGFVSRRCHAISNFFMRGPLSERDLGFFPVDWSVMGLFAVSPPLLIPLGLAVE